MKRIITFIIIILCGITLVSGGVYLLTDFAISKQTEDNYDNADVENSNEGENDDESVSSEGDGWFRLYLGTVTRYGAGANEYEVCHPGSEPGELTSYVFNVYWQDENGNAKDFGGSHLIVNGSNKNVGNTGFTRIGSIEYEYDNNSWFAVQRRACITPDCVGSSWGNVYVGMGTSGSFSNSSYTAEQNFNTMYKGSDSAWSTSTPSTGNRLKFMSGTYYIYLRETYSYIFTVYASTSGYGQKTVIAGLTTTAYGGGDIDAYYVPTGYTFAGWSTELLKDEYGYCWGKSVDIEGYATISSSYANQDREFYPVWVPNVYTISLDKQSGSGGTSTLYLKYNTDWYSNSDATTSISTITKPARTGYTFGGYYTETSGSGTQVVDSSGNIVSGRLTYIATNDTLYARWTINTYTLTLYYAGKGQSNDTNFTIGSTEGTVRNSEVAYPSGSDKGYVDCTYSTSSATITIKLTNAGSSGAQYYLRIGNVPTKTTYDKLFTSSSSSYSFTWTPTSNVQKNIYIYQRYTITYNKNEGSGTLPTSDTNKYKIHGTALTLGTNDLTRTSYTANGWNTNTTGTGTHYDSGGSYTADSNATLYADWSAKNSTINVQLKTSTNGRTYSNSATGGTVSVKYYYDDNNFPTQSSATSVTSASLKNIASNALISQAVTFTPTANSGYVFVGVSTSGSAPNSATATTFTPTTQNGTYTINVYFKVLSKNQLKYYDGYDSAIEHVSGYEFKEKANGYYESSNQGVNNSYSLCKVTFTITQTTTLNFNIINYAESNYDFGIFSNIDTTLTSSNSVDTTNVYKSYKGSSSSSVVTLTYSNISPGDHFIYIKFRKDGSINNNNDSLQFKIVNSEDAYWYFEEGEYPQSYVGTSLNNTLNGGGATANSTITYNNGISNKTIGVYSYNGKKYARLQAENTQTLKMNDGVTYTFTKGQYYWFEVEPIRWRISDYGVSSKDYPIGWATYGIYKTAFTVVSDRAIAIGAVVNADVKEGWNYLDSAMYYYIRRLNETESLSNFSANILNKQRSTQCTYYRFGSAGQQDKVIEFQQVEDGVRVASIEEIDDYLTDYSAKASDMVCFLLGYGADDYVEYWTRNLGVNLGNGQVVGESGSVDSCWLDNLRGVRLALTMADGSRI